MSEPLAVREAPASYVLEALRVKSGYKQAEVGVIPEDWDVARLGELFEITSSKRVFQSEWKAEGIPFYRAREIAVLGETGRIDNDLFISRQMYDSFRRTYGVPQVGDMLVTGVGTLGKVYVVPDDRELYFKDGNIIWFKINGAIHSGYLRQLYLTKLIVKQIEDASAGTTVGTYTITGAKKTVIPFPTKAEQEAIAEALSDADVLIESMEQLIAKKRHLKQGAMQELLTGKKRLPGFSGEWDVRTIEQLEKARLLQLSRGNVISKVDIECVPGDFPIYSSSVKSDGVFGNYGEYMFDEELITWSIDGGGHFFHRPRHKFSVTNVCGYMRADTSRFSFQFLAAQLQLLHSKLKFDYQDKAHPSVIRKAYLISIPSLEEQTAIATILSNMDTEIAALETRLAKTRSFKQGMMHNLLTGRIRLIEGNLKGDRSC